MKTKSQGVGLLADVRESLPALLRSPLAWHERVAPEHLPELAELKAAWKAGELHASKIATARIISAKLQERGIATIGPQGVLAWLEKA